MSAEAVPARPQWPVGSLLLMAAAVWLSVTTEMLPTGLLPAMSRDLSVSASQLGLLVTGYALMVAVFAAPLGLATGRLPRRHLLAATLLGYALSNAVMAISDSYPVALAARLVGGISHGVFWAMLAGYTARMVSAERVGRAVTIVATGGTAAVLFGVPVGTTLGLAIGWRPTFGLLAGVGVGLALAVWRLLPNLPGSAVANPTRMLAVLRNPALATIVVSTAVTMLGHFSFYTYVAPYLLHAGLAERTVGPVLLGYGLAGLVGLLLAGVFVDSRLQAATTVTIGLLTIAYAVLAAGPASVALAVIGSAATGAALGSLPVFLQTATLRAAPDAADPASAINASAFNVGIGGGALLGGLTLDHWGAAALPAVAATLTGVGLIAILIGRRVGRPVPASG